MPSMVLDHCERSMELTRPEDVASTALRLMDGFGAPWCVAGGWALDLFLGRVTRPHTDLELAIFRRDQSRLHTHFQGWTFRVAVNGQREAWQSDDYLESPLHEIHASSADEPPEEVEFLLNERDAERWVFRRDPAIVLPLERAIVPSGFEVPVLSPEIVLLFKSKSRRPKDQADFQAAASALGNSRRRWLRSALSVCEPSHPWVRELDR